MGSRHRRLRQRRALQTFHTGQFIVYEIQSFQLYDLLQTLHISQSIAIEAQIR